MLYSIFQVTSFYKEEMKNYNQFSVYILNILELERKFFLKSYYLEVIKK